MSTAVTSPVQRPAVRRNHAKSILWAVLGLAGISVLILSEYPIVAHPDAYTRKLIFDRLFLIPHAIAGVLATALGPFLFSTRFRAANLKRHRIMGRVYVICIVFASLVALYLGLRGFPPAMKFANSVMSVVWLFCTVAAFLTAKNRQLVAHRQWMIRSYTFTANFIIARVANPIPAYFNMSQTAFAFNLMFLTICYLFFTDLYFNWRELTRSRA